MAGAGFTNQWKSGSRWNHRPVLRRLSRPRPRLVEMTQPRINQSRRNDLSAGKAAKDVMSRAFCVTKKAEVCPWSGRNFLFEVRGD